MFIWDFVADKILGQIVDWFYGQVVGFLGNFFAEMGNMGVELFEMSWVQSIVLFFSYLAWALYGTPPDSPTLRWRASHSPAEWGDIHTSSPFHSHPKCGAPRRFGNWDLRSSLSPADPRSAGAGYPPVLRCG